MAGLSFGGLASGLDTDSIVRALVAVESRPITLLQQKRTSYQNQISAFDSLNSKLADLSKALEKLGDRTKFLAYAPKLSDESYFSVDANSLANPGRYEIDSITSLADSTLLRSSAFADKDTTTVGTGTLQIDVGGTTTDITIDSSNNTLEGVRDAINQSDAEVEATIVFDGTDYYLEIQGNETGTANAVSLTSVPTGGQDLAMTEPRLATDAVFSLNGLTITSSDNVIENSVEGITFTLNKTLDAADGPVILTIDEDFDAIEGQIEDFVNAYNEVVRFLDKQSDPGDPEAETNVLPALFGDSTVRLLRLAMGNALAERYDEADAGNFDSLGSIGVRFNNDGTLKLNKSDLRDALAEDLDSVTNLFTSETSGFTAALDTVVDLRTDRFDGLIKARKDGIQGLIKSLDRKIDQSEERLSRYEEQLNLRFSNFEVLMAQLQSQGNALSAIG